MFSRFHGIRVGDEGWAASPGETVRHGVVSLGPVRIGYHGDDNPMSIERACDVSDGLSPAIRKYDEIEAWSRQDDGLLAG